MSYYQELRRFHKVDAYSADKIKRFYGKCLKYNQLNNAEAESILDHDGTLGFIDALQQKTKGNPAVDVRLDM